MGKRLFRVFAKEIPARINTLLGIDLNLVLVNKSTIHGKILRCTNSEAVVEDFMQKKHTIRVADIIEIIYDKESSF
jgi:hypothetical protein